VVVVGVQEGVLVNVAVSATLGTSMFTIVDAVLGFVG
jgi:hypothetical protein